MARFDWYQATTFADVDTVARAALAAPYADLADLVPGRAKNGYLHGSKVRRGSNVLAEIWWGGNRGVHMIGTGVNGPYAAEVLRGIGEHRVTRADVSEDFTSPGGFDRVVSAIMPWAASQGIVIDQQGDWFNGKSRTLYLGSRKSAGQLVIYEKGYQMNADPDWFRIEVRNYPQKDGRLLAATLQPGQLLGAVPWIARALARIGWDHLEPMKLGTVWQPTDDERAFRWLVNQYGNMLGRMAVECGSWESVGQRINEERQLQQAAKAGMPELV